MQRFRFFVFLFLILITASYSFAQTGAKYLVITHDSFTDAISPLVEWKTKKGIPAVSVPLSQTGNTLSQIKSYIQNAYNNWSPRPDYVLLVGSPNLLPSYNDIVDDYYADMTGNYQIELCIGRFHCQTLAQCSLMVAKTIGYEKSETMHDSTWFSKGTTIVREDNPPDPYYQPDCRYIRNLWLDIGNYIHVDSFLSGQGYNQDSVINAINDGRTFVVFRGQSVSYWWTPFNVNPNNTNNGYKLPIIISGTCATITLAPGENMLGDAFMRAGTVQNSKGAVGFFGTTLVSSHVSQYRGAVTKGFFQALYIDSIFTMGGAAKRAKFIMDSLYPNQTRYMEWNLLGDPELNVWTSAPKELSVSHDSIIFVLPTNYQVSVRAEGTPVCSALVCVMMDSTVYTYGRTDSIGSVTLSFTPQHTGTLQVTVTAPNCFPYEGFANVVYRDVGITQIVRPSGTIDSTGPIIPQARVRNYGNNPVTFDVIFKIGNFYNQSRPKTLGPGVEDTVNFPPWVPVRGTYTTRCSTCLIGDTNPTNDTASGSVTVTFQSSDVGVIEIIAPAGQISSGTMIIPSARIANFGGEAETFPVYFRIISGADTLYYDDTIVTIDANQDSIIDFSSWNARPGFFNAFASTYLARDIIPDNDTALNSFTVIETGWQRLADVLAAPSGKNPKKGTCLAGLNGKIYLLKANKTPDFYCFTPNPSNSIWTTLDPIPLGTKQAGDGKDPKKGAAITAYLDNVYVLRGNNTQGFWVYFTNPTPGWQKLNNIPIGTKKPKYGTGLVYVNKNGEDCIFAMKGSKTNEFYLYSITSDNWQPVTSPPTGSSGKIGYKKGSCLAYDGDSLVYVLKGYYGDFFRYNVLTSTWTELRRMDHKIFLNREGKKKKVKDGSGLVYFNGAIYLLKGGKTNEFWKYDMGANNWEQMNPATIWDIPLEGGEKVKSGGGLCMLDNFFYALKGNNTPEFYRHGPPAFVFINNPNPIVSNGKMNRASSLKTIEFTIKPNPAVKAALIQYRLSVPNPISVKVYNASGELVKSYTDSRIVKAGSFTLDVKTIPAGIYILRFVSGNTTVTRKIVIEK